MNIRSALVKLLSATFMGIAMQSNAATQTVVLDQASQIFFADDMPYVQVTVSDDTAGQLDFLVESLPGVSDFAGDYFGERRFALNLSDTYENGISSDDFILPDGWSVLFGDVTMGPVVSTYDMRIVGRGADGLDPLRFSILGLSLGDVNTDFATYVHGFEDPDINFLGSFFWSEELLPPAEIPLPASLWLFASGLVGMLGMNRRRQRT